MLNQVILVGRVLHIDKEMGRFLLDTKGKGEERLTIWASDKIIDQMIEYKVSLVGVKGHLEELRLLTIIKADKISFLSTNK